MSYLSLTFVVFVAVFLAAYYLLPKKVSGVLLLCASLLFYLCFDLKYVLFLLFTAASTFFAALALAKGGKKKLILWGCIALNGLVWFAIKELPWMARTLSRALALVNIPFPELKWSLIVPVGISYYTLQAIGYLTDVYKGKIQPEKRFWKYLLFLSYFPAIVQGPISRYDRLMPQLTIKKPFSYDGFRESLILILFGLVKKMVIADRLGIFVNACFGGYEELRGVILYIGAVCYALQLYTDFSGCVDICRGVSGLFGVELVPNFNRPYLAHSIKDFWGRWHMSLSGWLKDYVYIPLGGNRKGTLRKYGNLLATFLVSGLWHGAGFNFLFWGILHGVYQIVGQHTQSARNKLKGWMGIQPDSASERIYQTLITFNLVTFAWIFFRAKGLAEGFGYVANMFSQPAWQVLFDGSLFEFGISQNHFMALLAHIVVLFMVETHFPRQQDVVIGLRNQHVIIRWVILWVLIFDVLLLGVYGSGYSLTSFMYGGF